jgi:hypothetical protein
VVGSVWSNSPDTNRLLVEILFAEGLIEGKITGSAFAAENSLPRPEVAVFTAYNVLQYDIHALLNEPGKTEPSAVEFS